MIHEFAVYPGLFDNETRITALHMAFGSEAGRLLSEYPSRQWAKVAYKVIEKSAANPDERRRWNTALMGLLKRASYRRQNADYNEAVGWITNAINEHHRRPFRAILNDERSAEPGVLRFSLDIIGNPHWSCPGSFHSPRNAEEMVRAVAPMLELSTTLVLVDPHFWATDGRWQKVLLRFARFLAETSLSPKITHIHYIVRTDDKISLNDTEREFRRLLEPDLPAGITVGFYLVLSALLHDRFVLTERGGVQFGRGLDEGIGDVLITRLSNEAYEREWLNASRLRQNEIPGLRHKFILKRP